MAQDVEGALKEQQCEMAEMRFQVDAKGEGAKLVQLAQLCLLLPY